MQILPDPAPGNRLPSARGALACILLAGMLSMLCAEVFSGASVLWFLQPLGWLLTFPLYLAHLLFFLNVAFLSGRISLPSLYLFGVLFGLYETWITKVAWAGYIGQSPAYAPVLGFATVESAIILFFWHPVMSCILPVLVFEVLSLSSSGENPVILGHMRLLTKTPLHLAAALGIAIAGAAFLSMNSGFNLISALPTLFVTVLLVGVLLYIARRWNGHRFSVFSLSLGRRAFLFLCLYLALLYALTFIFLLPERIPPWETLLLTIAFYLMVLVVLWIDSPVHLPQEREDPGARVIDQTDLVKCVAGMAVFIVLFCLIPSLGSLAGTVLYLAFAAAGPVLAILAFMKIAGDHLGQM